MGGGTMTSRDKVVEAVGIRGGGNMENEHKRKGF